MAKNASGEGKGATKNMDQTRSVDAQNAIRRAAKARRKHSASGIQTPGMHILAEVAKERREQMLQVKKQRSAARAQWRENIRLQSELAQVFVAQWEGMNANERLIASSVAKAFVESVKADKMSRTAVAKDKVRKVWESNPNLRARVTKRELDKGLRIGGAVLTRAGKEVFEKTPEVESESTDETPVSA